MPFARCDGPDLYFEVSGSGPRLLFINGSGLTLEDAGLITAVLASRFEVLAYDYRGLGRSGEVSGGYTMAECATDAVCVLDAAGWPSAPVVGISFGGMVALEAAFGAGEGIIESGGFGTGRCRLDVRFEPTKMSQGAIGETKDRQRCQHQPRAFHIEPPCSRVNSPVPLARSGRSEESHP